MHNLLLYRQNKGIKMENEYFNIKQLADKFCVSYRTILRSVESGKIRAFRVGRGKRSPWRIHKSEILRIETVGILEKNPNLETSNLMTNEDEYIYENGRRILLRKMPEPILGNIYVEKIY